MKSYTIKLQKPGTKLEKKNQLAWLIANMAAEDWNLNKKISYQEVLKSIKKRDKSDIKRKISPLRKTKDSLLINTTNLTKRSCFLKIKKIIDRKINI